jgi:hypothetical protein
LIRAVGAGALGALLAALALAPSAHACDAGTRVQASHGGATGGRAPLVIGDSTMIFAAPVLGGLGLEADAHGCRGFSDGVSMLAARKADGTLPQVAVLALGANGGASGGAIGNALGVMGRDRVLGLVTPRNNAGAAAAMHTAAAQHPTRVRLIDWVSFSAGHDGWFAGDSLHVTHEGASAYAHLIKDAIAPLAFPPVADLKMPARAAGTTRCGAVRRGGQRFRVYVTLRKERISCARARTLARTSGLRLRGWRVYDWEGTGNGPWAWVLARADHEVVVGLVEA